MNDNKFFFITICWNNLQGLKRTVSSLLDQSYSNWECVIIDGNSNDGTKAYLAEVVAEHMNITAVSEPDKGIYDAMNKGLDRMPECNFFCFLNSGDSLFSADTLQLLNSKLLDLAESPAIVYGDTCELFEGGTEVIKPASNEIHLEKGMFCCHQSMFFHYRYRSMRYDLTYRLSADYDYIVRAVKMLNAPSELVKLNMAISRFDMTGASNSQRVSGIMEDFRLRVKNGLCSTFSSATYALRSFCLMGLKRFSYPLYLWMRRV